VSEFYESRRSIISDVSALSGFAVGALVASAFAWRILATGFRTGEMERAMFNFLAIVFGAGFVGGALGLFTGRAGGRVWEGRHRRDRAPAPYEPEPAAPRAASPDRSVSTDDEFDPDLGLHIRMFGAEVDQFMVLLRRAHSGDAMRTATQLSHTANFGAYDGPRLVAAARVLTDGRFWQVAEVLVDPDYAGRDVAPALLRRVERAFAGQSRATYAP
jgi:hypothetical protein